MFTRTQRPLSRRRILELFSLLSSGGLAGCFSPQMGGPTNQLAIYNGTEQSVAVSVAVYRLPSKEIVVEERVTLAPETERNYEDLFTEDGRKRLTIVVDSDRHDSYEWQTTADASSSGVSINIYEDEIRTRQIAA